jgi:hypothetical protein
MERCYERDARHGFGTDFGEVLLAGMFCDVGWDLGALGFTISAVKIPGMPAGADNSEDHSERPSAQRRRSARSPAITIEGGRHDHPSCAADFSFACGCFGLVMPHPADGPTLMAA